MTTYHSDCGCKDKLNKAGTDTTDIYVSLDANGTSTLISRTKGCSSIPRKSGGSLSLSLYTSAGQYAGLSALPSMVNAPSTVGPAFYEDGGVSSYSTSVGTLNGMTYYIPDAPQAATARAQSGGPYFVYEMDAVTGITTVFYGPHVTLQPPGAIFKRSDPNNNTLYYVYNAMTATLSQITGDVSGVTPNFFYSTPAGQLVKIFLNDNANSATSRSIYFQYDPTYGNLQKVTFPNGCTQSYQYLNSSMGIANIYKEVDAEGNATYFRYTNSTNQVLQATFEPLNRATYYSYGSSGGTKMVLLGRPAAYFAYTPNSGGTINISQRIDALGNSTYFNFSNSADGLPTTQQDPNGNITQFANDSVNYVVLKRQSSFNGATTYYAYAANHQDLQKTVGPRNVPVTFPVVTYYQYNATRNRIKMTDALGNTTATIPDSAGRPHVRQDARANTTYYNYSATTGQNISIVDANNQVTYFQYNSFADKTKAVSPRWREANSYAAFTTYYAYDSNDRVTQITNPLQQSTTMSYTAIGDLLESVDPRNVTTAYVNNALRLLVKKSVANPLGANVWNSYYNYDIAKNRISDLNANGKWTYYAYDVLNRKRATRDALANASYFYFDSVSNTTGRKDPNGHTNYYFYDALSRMSCMRDALGHSSYYRYDLANNRYKSQDARTNTTYYGYDALNRLTSALDPLNNVVSTVYDQVGNRHATKDPRGNLTYFTYDALNRVSSVVDAANNVMASGYDASSNRRVSRDPRLNSTYYIYDALNRVTSIVNAQLGTATTAYDSVGNVIKVTDQNVNPSYYSYDSLSRPITLINAAASVTYYFYDPVGNRTKVRDQVVTVSYYFYDAINRPIVTRDGLGQTTYFYYDRVGNRTKVRDARANTTYFAYDAINRLSMTVDALADKTYFGYDAVSNRTLVRDGLSHTNVFRYDPDNRATAFTDGVGKSAYFSFDAVGNQVKQQDQRGNTTYYAYDVLNRLASILDPLGYTTRYVYDANSNLHATLDNLGQSTYFQYDSLNRRTRTYLGIFGYGIQDYGTTPYGGSSGETQYFKYDPVGNLTTAIGAISTASYRYDALNRVTRKTSDQTSAYFTYVVRGDNQSFLSTICHPGNVSASYVYNKAQMIASVTAPSTKVTTYARNPVSNLSKAQFGNATVCYYGYDAAERLSQIQHFTSAGQGIAYFIYQRDAANRITRITREMAAIYYSYDNADRLTLETWVKKNTGVQIYGFQYTYDQAGNRIKCYRAGAVGVEIDAAYYVYDASNALSKRIVLSPSATMTYYTYDANGSIILIYEGTNATYFTYGGNQLISQITPPASAGLPWQFGYDAQLSRRKIVKGALGASYYLWNGMNQLEERNAAGSLMARYTHGSPIVPGVGSVVEVQRPSYFQYVHMDHQGSVAKVTDANQNVQISYVRDAFGRQIVAPGGSNPNVPNDLVFQSNWITANVGTKQFGISPSRVYDFETGRFLQRDPLPSTLIIAQQSYGNTLGVFDYTTFTLSILQKYYSNISDIHRYNFGFSDPSNMVDPSGMYPPPPPGKTQNPQPTKVPDPSNSVHQVPPPSGSTGNVNMSGGSKKSPPSSSGGNSAPPPPCPCCELEGEDADWKVTSTGIEGTAAAGFVGGTAGYFILYATNDYGGCRGQGVSGGWAGGEGGTAELTYSTEHFQSWKNPKKLEGTTEAKIEFTVKGEYGIGRGGVSGSVNSDLNPNVSGNVGAGMSVGAGVQASISIVLDVWMKCWCGKDPGA